MRQLSLYLYQRTQRHLVYDRVCPQKARNDGLHHAGVCGRIRLYASLGTYDGSAVDQQIRYTRMWAISSEGTWQIVAGHARAVAPE